MSMFHSPPDPVSKFLWHFEECCGVFSDKREGGFGIVGEEGLGGYVVGGSGSGSVRVRLVGYSLSDGSLRLVGVAGILRKEQEMWQKVLLARVCNEAFQDLNARLSEVIRDGHASREDEAEAFVWLELSKKARVACSVWYHIPSIRRVCCSLVSSTTCPVRFCQNSLEKAGGMINLIRLSICLLQSCSGHRIELA
ncbi:hypothetical protein NC651_019326 [Populus alba x Populus x berolinensis]|nr:hypothetical protein NC651_019326 [Populus alba x Populus x berolinensis]